MMNTDGFSLVEATLHPYTIALKHPFRISAGEIREKHGLLIEVRADNGLTGWGEASVDRVPFYAHETVGSAIDLIQNSLMPLMRGRKLAHPDEAIAWMDHYRGGNFAKAAIDAAAWDIYGQMCGKPCWQLLGGVRDTVESGPSMGIKEHPDMLCDAVAEQLDRGMRRIKLKVMPGKDFDYIAAVRRRYPGITLMVDANNAYGIGDFAELARWDDFNLLMIEQPLDERDIYFHSLLRRKITSPICLDESIHTPHDAECCAALEAADIVNIKVCRTGGLTRARQIHDICQRHNIRNWIGSRVGSGVAEAPRLAAATLPNCTLASDCVFSMMYMSDDILAEPYAMSGCMIRLSPKPGLGITVDRDKLRRYAPSPLIV